MDVILKVLEGSKAGTKVAIKKDEFLIGRSPKCHLCAGSTTISRRHCALRRKEATITIEDLGSRNGTLINGKKITEETELSTGDEIDVGSLKFLVTITHGINNAKKPQVKSVADAVDRAAAGGSSVDDDDISNWLLDADPAAMGITETQTIQLDETNAVQVKEKMAASAEAETEEVVADDETEESTEEKEGGSKKKKPGKLPPMPNKPSSKDSREAAMEALRNWNRRR